MFQTVESFNSALATLPQADDKACEAALARQAQLTKPAGSLGRLEDIVLFMAGWQGNARPVINKPLVAVFAGNHGFTVHGVSAFPPSVTEQMVRNFEMGGAAINALSRLAGADLKVVALELERPTADFTREPAMTEAECLNALQAGVDALNPDTDCLVIGEMGIGNTTAASALCAQIYGGGGVYWAGRGSGLDASGVSRKAEIVERAVSLHQNVASGAFEILRRLGGREIAAMAGAVLAARHRRIPVVLDGFISCAAIAPLKAVNPAITDHCLAGHVSAEAGHERLLNHLDVKPILSLAMRLGEASGGAVALHIIKAALATHNEMATFAEAGVTAAG